MNRELWSLISLVIVAPLVLIESLANAQVDTGQLERLQLTTKAIRHAEAKIRPCLVTIESFGGVSAVQGRIGGIRKQGEGNTTGIMISPDGYVVTSTFNFIQQPPVITVITHDGQRRFAKLVGRDDSRKLCLLKIEDCQGMPVPEMVEPDALKVGQWALSVGVGYGDTNPAVSLGIISALNRVGGRAIQTDANISPANYGGPLVDIEGRLIGICVPMNPQSQAVGAGVEWYDSGIGFVISIYGKEDWIERMKRGEKIYPAFLGVRAVPSKEKNGVVIEEVVSKSPAEQAGLIRGERIISINDQPVHDMMRLKQLLNRFESGQAVELVVVTDPDDDVSDDELIRRQNDPDWKPEEPAERTLAVILGRPPAPQGAESQLEPPQIR